MKRELDKLLVAMAAFYGAQLTETQLDMWANLLSGIPFEKIQGAVMHLMRDPSVTRMPLPSMVIKFAQPQAAHQSDEDVARDIAGKIWEMIGHIGSHRPETARQKLGPIAWEVVERMGGWGSICMTELDERGTFMAQARDMALARIRLNRAGQGAAVYQIPSPENPSPIQSPANRVVELAASVGKVMP